ncbi:hypothetical protein JIN85_15160 [Luteolibacter pohnpeiensis]|uniref:Uncharacterized protein n=1 Tax=Luteolibacter pohnpeiensis TaxID=454153 RepID=A0A934SAA0_9BACT|nr:hypothetical protein [Luteolibacter pohnpeiensis]MBK1883756.1 hypothetical protein [Luteolibacter pohnpeiensis]
MLEPQEVVDTYFLEARYMALELAAWFDRYDSAVQRSGVPAPDDKKLRVLRQALQQLASPEFGSERTEMLLELFAAT